MSKVCTLLFFAFSFSVMAQEAPVAPDYGKLLLIEERPFTRHWEAGIDGGVAMDTTTQDVYSLGLMGNYVFTPIFSLGLEANYNKTEDKPYLEKLKKAGNVRITHFTPEWFSQLTLRANIIKGHLNLINKWNSPFEIAAVLGGGLGYNEEQSKSSSLLSWGGEFQVPTSKSTKVVVGIRHYKSYPFQDDELSFTSLFLGLRKVF